MKCLRDGRVYTDFIIYDAADYVKYIHEQEAFAAKNIEAYLAPAKDAIEKLKQKPYYSHRLERFMLINIADNGLYVSMKPLRKVPQECPTRPNGGRWIAFGTIISRRMEASPRICAERRNTVTPDAGVRLWTAISARKI